MKRAILIIAMIATASAAGAADVAPPMAFHPPKAAEPDEPTAMIHEPGTQHAYVIPTTDARSCERVAAGIAKAYDWGINRRIACVGQTSGRVVTLRCDANGCERK
jgi:hypothetical protein